MKIPIALRYNVPRGGWEFAFTGLGGMSADLVAVAAGLPTLMCVLILR